MTGQPVYYLDRIMRLMAREKVANDIGTDASFLICMIASQQKATGFSRPVDFWTNQLMAVCGFRSRKRLVAARKAAVKHGWLKYCRGRKSVPGTYRISIPPKFETTWDGPIEHTRDPVSEEFRSDLCPEMEGQTEDSVPFRNGKRGFCSDSLQENADSVPMRNSNTPDSVPIRGTILKNNNKEVHVEPNGFDEFWEEYPLRNGRKLGKQLARDEFGRLSTTDQSSAILAAKNLASSGQIPKDAHRFLKGGDDAPFREWASEPVVSHRHDDLPIFGAVTPRESKKRC